jgi:WD40 repeat protein
VRVDAHIPDPKIVIRRIRALNVPPLPPDLGALIQPDGRKFSSASETLVLDNALDSQTRGTWRPRQGVITLTFSEHVRAVNRLAVSQDQTFFVSASDDRTAKIWSLRGLENSVAPRSTLTYATHKGKVLDVCVCENTHSVATCSDDGSVHVWRVDVEHDSAALYETSANTGVAVTGTSVIKTIDPCEVS